MIVVLAAKSGLKDFKMPSILRTIVQDATVYFLVIFTSHFVLEMTLLLARVTVSVVCTTAMLIVPPAKSSTLTSYVSARFEVYQRTLSHHSLET